MKTLRVFFLVFLVAVLQSLGCRRGDTGPAPATSNDAGETSEADAESTPPTEPDPTEATAPSASIRNPNDGMLENGVPLPLEAPGLRFNPKNDPAARYGTEEMVAALMRAAAVVDEELGGLPVIISDLSYEGGGPIPRHGSHQSGRDVDVLFYQLDQDGQPIESVGAFFDPEGAGVDFKELDDPSDDVMLTLDMPRTWRFVQALIEDPDANLQSIFVVEHIRTLLLRYARSANVDAATVTRFAQMTCQPEYPHDDHFHFRFYCSIEDIAAGCRDSKPEYPWRRRALREAGIESLPLLPKRPQSKSKTVSHAEARERAGELDPEVERWLDLRQAWIKKPHPGRKFCR